MADDTSIYLPSVSVSRQVLQPKAQLGGLATDLGLDGKLAVVATGHRLTTADLSDPSAPRFIGRSELLDHRLDAVVIGQGFAWASVPAGPLLGFDLSQPDQPRLSTITRLPGQARWFARAPLAMASGRIYVGVHARIHAVDVRDPLAPRWLGAIELPDKPGFGRGAAFALAARGDLVYAVGYYSDDLEGKLVVIDWANPGVPQVVRTSELAMNPTYSLALAGDWLVAARSHVEFYDITLPRSPELVGWAGRSELQDRRDGQRLPGVDQYFGGVAAEGQRLWLTGEDSLVQLDSSGSWPPSILGQTAGVLGSMVDAGEGFAVVVAAGGLTQLTAVEAASARTMGAATRLGNVPKVLLADRRAYAGGAYGSGVEVVDIEDIDQPRRIGRLPVELNDLVHVDDVRAVEVAPSHHVRFWDIRDPQQPTLAVEHAASSMSTYGHGAVQYGRLYLPGHEISGEIPTGGIFSMPVDGSAAPVFWPWEDPPTRNAPTRVALFGHRVVLADEKSYLVLDVSAELPSVLAEGRFQQRAGRLTDLVTSAEFLVAVFGQRLEIHRLAGDDAPAYHSAVALPVTTYADRIAFSGRIIFTTSGQLVAWELDRDLRGLRQLSETAWPAMSVQAQGKVVATAGSFEGLRLWQIADSW